MTRPPQHLVCDPHQLVYLSTDADASSPTGLRFKQCSTPIADRGQVSHGIAQVQESCQPEELLDFLAGSEGSEAADRADSAAESLRVEEQVRCTAMHMQCRHTTPLVPASVTSCKTRLLISISLLMSTC